MNGVQKVGSSKALFSTVHTELLALLFFVRRFKNLIDGVYIK
jgi:hypothetical protein